MLTERYFQPADVIAISGNSCLSRLIRASTIAGWRGISHVAIISRGPIGLCWWESSNSTETPDILADKPVSGVGCTSIVPRLEEEARKRNRVWRYRLSQPLAEVEVNRLDAWLRSQHGKPYDYHEARLARIFGGGTIRRLAFNRKGDLSTLFCSELAFAALRWIGVFHGGVASDWAPAPFCRFLEKTGIARPEWVQGPVRYWGREVRR